MRQPNSWLQQTVGELLTFPVTRLLTRVCAAGMTYCCSAVDEHLRSTRVAYLNRGTTITSAQLIEPMRKTRPYRIFLRGKSVWIYKGKHPHDEAFVVGGVEKLRGVVHRH